LAELSKSTYEFFEKLPGYETLRLLLCKKAILVEGPSDELIIQRAYKDKYEIGLPIENEIDVISVGLTFKRFLEVADLIHKPVAVVTDNDNDYKNNILRRYEKFRDSETIEIFADKRDDLNTLEPQIVDANSKNLGLLCGILGIDENVYNTIELISNYMIENKTKCALKIFNAKKSIIYPKYIDDVIDWCNE
jgi:putative ATP-dependent endonuclease of OLD family